VYLCVFSLFSLSLSCLLLFVVVDAVPFFVLFLKREDLSLSTFFFLKKIIDFLSTGESFWRELERAGESVLSTQRIHIHHIKNKIMFASAARVQNSVAVVGGRKVRDVNFFLWSRVCAGKARGFLDFFLRNLPLFFFSLGSSDVLLYYERTKKRTEVSLLLMNDCALSASFFSCADVISLSLILSIIRDLRAQVQSSIKRTRKTSSIKCSASSEEESSSSSSSSLSRRQAVLSTAAGAVALTQNVNPSYALSGFNVVKETREGYQFIYPVGWQEISVDGQAKVFKDIIEPLESISLNIYPTERESLKDIGTAQEVAETLVKQALSAPGALGKLLSAKERTDKDGHLYYSFEFVSKTKSYERHALTTVTITQGKFFTLTTGSSERRWDKMKDRLNAANDSFLVYY
jgi:photosystem II oxygen-evolving enhancer protein 2